MGKAGEAGLSTPGARPYGMDRHEDAVRRRLLGDAYGEIARTQATPVTGRIARSLVAHAPTHHVTFSVLDSDFYDREDVRAYLEAKLAELNIESDHVWSRGRLAQ
jgi:hypothetical protein